MSRKNVILIEDELQLADSVKEMLTIMGYHVYLANNGSNALNLINGIDNIDIIICDINLPDISGYEILEKVKADKIKYKIPFLFLSAYADEKDIRKGMNIGADDYITKPFQMSTLLDAISSRIIKHEKEVDYDHNQLNEKLFEIVNKNFSHEFLTPLNGILSLSKIISDTEDANNEIQELVQGIYASGYRMFRNVRKLVFYATIIANNKPDLQPDSNNVNLSELIDGILERMQFKNLIRTDIIPGIISDVNKDYITLLLEEIIDNAVKYKSAGTTPQLILYKSNNKFYFKITNSIDRDINITTDSIAAFKKFHNDLSLNGLGLGLFIAKEICKLLNYDFKLEIKNRQLSVIIIQL